MGHSGSINNALTQPASVCGLISPGHFYYTVVFLSLQSWKRAAVKAAFDFKRATIFPHFNRLAALFFPSDKRVTLNDALMG